jgi:molecular chaperone DnaK
VLQGERPLAADNMSLGQFNLEGIPPAPRGVPQVEVTFDIDANGILNVNARDKATGREQKITITASTNLNEGDVERMVGEAKRNEAEDRRKRELIEARNTADAMVYQTEKAMRELGDKVPDSDRGTIESKIEELKGAMPGDDIQRIRRLTEEVQQASYALGQQMYAQEGAPGAGMGGTPGYGASGAGSGNGDGRSGTDEDVIEGEFTEA